jgi:hypothetical protein
MNPFEPLPAPRPRRYARRAFEIAGRIAVVLALLSGVAYLLATATGQI